MQHLQEVVGNDKEVEEVKPQASAPKVVEAPNASTRIVETADGNKVTLERLQG